MTNEKQMECRYLTPNIPKLRVKVLKVIELVIPDEKNSDCYSQQIILHTFPPRKSPTLL